MFKRLTYNKESLASYKWFHQEINKLEVVFQNNDFPKSFVNFYIKKYLDKKLNKFDLVCKTSERSLFVFFILSEKITSTENSFTLSGKKNPGKSD